MVHNNGASGVVRVAGQHHTHLPDAVHGHVCRRTSGGAGRLYRAPPFRAGHLSQALGIQININAGLARQRHWISWRFGLRANRRGGSDE